MELPVRNEVTSGNIHATTTSLTVIFMGFKKPILLRIRIP
jgi:hypothetical protein